MQGDVGVRLDGIKQGVVYGFACGICCMGYAAHGVAAFAGEVQPQGALRIRREGHALRYQPSYGGFAVLCNMLRCALIDYACASV